MSKVLNKMFLVLLMLVSFVLCFSGCNLWTLNEQKVLNQTAAKIDDIEVTYEDVYDAYYSYGNYYFDGQGTATYNGIEQTATQLINRKLLLKALKDENGKYHTTLTQSEINDVWNSIYESLNDTIESYQKQIMEKDNKTLTTLETSDEEAEESGYQKSYQAYQKTYEYVLNENNEYELKKIIEPDEIVTTSSDVFKFSEEEMAGFNSLKEKLDSMTTQEKASRAYNNFRENFWTHYADQEKNSKGEVYAELAFNKFISVLKSNEKDKGLSTDTKEVFYRYLDKLFEEQYDSALISAFQKNYENKEQITESTVLKVFNNLASAQNEKYRDDYNNYSAFVSAMKNRSEPMLYFDKTNEWFQVSHILLKFSDEDVATLKKLQTEYKDGKFGSGEEAKSFYEEQVLKVKNSMKFLDRKTNKSYSAQEVLKMLQDAMGISVDGAGKVSYSKDEQARLNAFNDFIYRFNMDDGVNNADYAYYIPEDEENDSMVTPFANTSRELRATKTVGAISDLVEVNEIDGYLDNSNQTQTPSYSGYHIVVYLGEIQTLNTDQTATIEDLNNYVLNPLNNNETNKKTMLDYVIEQISISNYSKYQSSVLAGLKENKTINYYEGVLKQLVEKFS
ncbi:MAG: hypothetical protein IJ837_01280 [Clostridia bacterium]|nr:hypothetical protein [Clostridia bacterium]